jgi:tryptophan-rich sensory protein
MGKTALILGALGWLLLCFGAAFVGSRFPVDDWYTALAKPSWNPPNWLFGPVWTLLYTLMAFAAWLVWRDRGFAGAIVPLGAFLLQLVLNAAWSWLFFGQHRIVLALIEIGFLWIAILFTLLRFWQINPISGILMLPYLVWVSFASVLNYALWRLNR